MGVNATYYTNENTKVDELYEDAYRYRKGKPTDGMWGLQAEGSTTVKRKFRIQESLLLSVS